MDTFLYYMVLSHLSKDNHHILSISISGTFSGVQHCLQRVARSDSPNICKIQLSTIRLRRKWTKNKKTHFELTQLLPIQTFLHCAQLSSFSVLNVTLGVSIEKHKRKWTKNKNTHFRVDTAFAHLDLFALCTIVFLQCADLHWGFLL